MARFVAGDVVVLPFPFTNQADSKNRPAVVLCSTPNNDLLVCMISSAAYGAESIPLDKKNLESSGLRVAGVVRPDRLLVADPDLVIRKTGRISVEMTGKIKSHIAAWIQG
ncbi:MAG: type II toxin-antitoxin system PemK/MazF family toxin [Desulfovibrio sp.]|jgi:mRNA interferase MazF|nr:type II toxin-antitoxin system PemK/MazF family toxin [Desulfovibrio sp.]